MAEFKANPSGMNEKALEMRGLIRTLKSLEGELKALKLSMNLSDKSLSDMKKTMGTQADQIGEQYRCLQDMISVLTSAATLYRSSEMVIGKLVPLAVQDSPETQAGMTVQAKLHGDTNYEESSISALFPFLKDQDGSLFISYGYRGNLKDEEETKYLKKGVLGKWQGGNREERSYVLDKKSWREVPKTDDGGFKIDWQKFLYEAQIYSHSESTESSFLRLGMKEGESIHTPWGDYTFSGGVGNWKVEKGKNAGLFGGGLISGLSFSGLRIETNKTQSDPLTTLGIHKSNALELLSFRTGTQGTFGLWDKDHKFDLHGKIKMDAEAVAVKMQGTMGVDILDGKLDAKADAGFGLGGHVDFGLENGVLKADIGAYLGPGMSVSLEADLSGTVEKAVECAQQADKSVEKIKKDLVESGKGVYYGAANLYEDKKDDIAKAYSTMEKKAEEAVDKTLSRFKENPLAAGAKQGWNNICDNWPW